MENNRFIDNAREIIEKVVNIIASKDYSTLANVVSLDDSWVEPGKTLEEACISFGEWLDEQLQMWSDDYAKDIVIDPFDDAVLEELEVIKDEIITTYDPTSNGERLDLWFEFEFVIESEQIKGTFNIGL